MAHADTSAQGDRMSAPASRWQPYPAYKDSGVEWLGKIPSHWVGSSLKRWVETKITDGPHETPEFVDEGIPFVSAEAVKNGRIDFASKRGYITPELHNLYSKKVFPQRHDIFLVKSGATTGKLAIVDVDFEFSVWSPLALIRADLQKTTPRFLFQALHADYVQKQVERTWSAGTQPNISMAAIERLYIAIPPLDEQQTIAAFLDRETAKIDALIAKKQRLIDLLHEQRAALISHAVTKGLDPSVPMRASGIAWLGEIPAHWKTTRLMYLTEIDRPIMYGIVLPGPNVEKGVPIVKGGDVAPDRLKLELLNRTTYEIESKYERSRLRADDIVYAIRGSIGMAEIVPSEIEGANLTQDAARIAPKDDINVSWLLYVVKSRPFFAQLDAGALGATIRGINIRDLKRGYVPAPPNDEQQSIADYLDSETQKIETLKKRVYQAVDKLKEYRTALISAAVTGKIDVRGEV